MLAGVGTRGPVRAGCLLWHRRFRLRFAQGRRTRGPGGGGGCLRRDARSRPREVRPQPVLRGVPHRRRARPALSRRGTWSRASPDPPGGRSRGGRDERRLRRLHRGLWHPQRARHHAGLQRDAAGLPAWRQGSLPGDHPAPIPVFKQFYALWFNHAVPGWASSPPETSPPTATCQRRCKRFPAPDDSEGLMEAAGLRNVRYEILAGGIIALHHGLA